MVKVSVCDTFPFILLFWFVVRVVAESTADYIFKQDTFVNHGLRNVTTVSDLQCCITCMLDDTCESVSFNDADRVCQVNDRNPDIDKTATTTSSVGWTSFYHKLCRKGWFFQNAACYHLVTIRQNWTNSESHCQALGGHLVDFQSTDEEQFVWNYADKAFRYNMGYYSPWWIGFRRDENGTWVWSSSVPNTLDWPIGKGDGLCIALYLIQFNTWMPKLCSNELYSVCKADI